MNNFSKFSYKMLIKEKHLDSFGHVNNAIYLEILEEARWELLTERGLGLKQLHKSGFGPIILECTLKFLKELRLRQGIFIESQMQSYENKIGIMKQEIFNEKKELCCEALFTFGIFDLKERKLILPPKLWLSAIGKID